MADNFTEYPLPPSTFNPTPESQQLMVEILTAATKLMREKGFLGTTVEDLVEAVGIPKGTLYYHIGTKERLLYRIHEHVTIEGLNRWRAILDDSDGFSTSVVLERMIHEHCAIIETYRDWVAVITEEMKFLSPNLQSEIRLRRLEYQQLLESVLERGIKKGEFVDRPIHLTASAIIGELNSIYRWYSPDGRLSAGAMETLVSSVILKGVRVRATELSGHAMMNS
jgi:AcrR family transcriptional regulator